MSKERDKKQNTSLYEEYLRCGTYQRVADNHGISLNRAMVLVKEEAVIYDLKENHKDMYALYEAIYNLPLSQPSSSRLYHALRRRNINTLEQLQGFSADNLLKLRDIGRRSVRMLFDAGLITDEEGVLM